jgi:hypothetical protein
LQLKAVAARERKAVYYLAGIFDRAGVEAKALTGKSNEDIVLTQMLKEIQDLAVSYCASSLTVPDLFDSAVAAPSQLFSCLSTNSHNIASGSASSFLHRVCKELSEQEEVRIGSRSTSRPSSLSYRLRRLTMKPHPFTRSYKTSSPPFSLRASSPLRTNASSTPPSRHPLMPAEL